MSETETATATVGREVVDILNPDQKHPNSIKGYYTDAQREVIREAIAAGDVIATPKNIKVGADKSGTGKDELWPYVAYSALNDAGMLALSAGRMDARVKVDKDSEAFKALDEAGKAEALANDIDGAADYFNYGYGLSIMQPIRLYVADNVGGPEKAVVKQIDAIMKLGLFPTREAARALVIKQRRDQGLAVPE